MDSFIISIVLFFVLIGILKVMTKLLDSAKVIRDKKGTESWLRYGLISKKDLYNLDSYEFEKWCGFFLEKQGYHNVVITEENLDGGKDIICERKGEKIYVECKKYGFPSISDNYNIVSRDIIQKLVGAMVHDRIYKGMIITTGLISERSKEYVKGLPKIYEIELIDGDELIKQHRELREKNIYIQNTAPDIEMSLK